jgi:hypothetical protein
MNLHLLLSPYIADPGMKNWFARRSVMDPTRFSVYPSINDATGWKRVFDLDTIHSSAQEAMDALDKDLIGKGFILLTEKQWDKLLLLL